MPAAKFFTAFGETKAIKDWLKDKRCACNFFCLRHRLLTGWNTEEAILTPTKNKDAKQMKVGEKINHLTLKEIFHKTEESGQRYKYGRFECDCDGKIVEYRYRSVVAGETHSCGCWRSKRITLKYQDYEKLYSVGFDHAILRIWYEIKRKCYIKTNKKYKFFGAKGIKLCEEWQDFEKFKIWCDKNKYEEGKVLKRHFLNKDFDKDNCYWIDKNFTKERLYKIWFKMKQRCYNPKMKEYRSWGARGIKICQEWHSYMNFREWSLNNGYSDNLSIDKMDNNYHYCPKNCRWATQKQQLESIYNNRQILAFGEVKSLLHWTRDKRCSIDTTTLRKRVLGGWDVEEAISQPIDNKHD